MYTIGIDIGSSSAKAAVLDTNSNLVFCEAVPTGWSSVDASERLHALLEEHGFMPDEAPCIATGYGRVSVPYAKKAVTEITCHAKGAVWLHDAPDMIVIDIGGQDSKIIRVRGGRMTEFLMNDKCSAGTGRFLEIMSGTMGLRPDELCELARGGQGAAISSLCTVFAESEVVSLIGRGEAKENIAHAVVESIVDKISAQTARLAQRDDSFCLTGGLCCCTYLREALAFRLKAPLMVRPEGRFAGAIGAALAAR